LLHIIIIIVVNIIALLHFILSNIHCPLLNLKLDTAQ